SATCSPADSRARRCRAAARRRRAWRGPSRSRRDRGRLTWLLRSGRSLSSRSTSRRPSSTGGATAAEAKGGRPLGGSCASGGLVGPEREAHLETAVLAVLRPRPAVHG